MGQTTFDASEIGVPCPKCGHQARASLGQLRANPHRECAGCGAAFTVDTHRFDQQVKTAVEAARQRLGKALKRR